MGEGEGKERKKRRKGGERGKYKRAKLLNGREYVGSKIIFI